MLPVFLVDLDPYKNDSMFSTFMDMLILKTEMYKIFKQMSKWNEFKEWCFCINKNEFTSEKM